MNKVKRLGLHCKRCDWKWFPRSDTVTICPKCKSAYWNKDRNGTSVSQEAAEIFDKIKESVIDGSRRYIGQPLTAECIIDLRKAIMVAIVNKLGVYDLEYLHFQAEKSAEKK